MRYMTIALLLPALAMLSGCGGSKSRTLSPDPSFSYNLITVPSDWPDEKIDWPKDDPDLALRQQQVYERYGVPDYFFVRWRRDGRPITEGELTQMLTRQARNARRVYEQRQPELDWVYLDERLLFSFPRTGTKREDLPDEIRIIADYGDPGEVRQTRDVNGNPVTSYHYYDEGMIYYFTDGKLTREESVTRMPGMILRR